MGKEIQTTGSVKDRNKADCKGSSGKTVNATKEEKRKKHTSDPSKKKTAVKDTDKSTSAEASCVDNDRLSQFVRERGRSKVVVADEDDITFSDFDKLYQHVSAIRASENKSSVQTNSQSESSGKIDSQSESSGKKNSQSESSGKINSQSESSGKKNSQSESSGKKNSQLETSGKKNSQSESSDKKNSQSETSVEKNSQSETAKVEEVKEKVEVNQGSPPLKTSNMSSKSRQKSAAKSKKSKERNKQDDPSMEKENAIDEVSIF
jgi:hypothetical protein